MSDREVIIVGAGLAGLTCAWRLRREGVPFLVLEASDGIGGRVRTDEVDGFLLDRGFQVLLTAYPETQTVLNYAKLGIKTFNPGALVWKNGRFHRLSDPWRDLRGGMSTLASPIGTLADKLRVARLRSRVRRLDFDEIWRRPEHSSLRYLNEMGFSDGMIESFFRPFFGGIFLENQLTTSSRMLEFVFQMFSNGFAALPAEGMGAIPRAIAEDFPEGAIRLNAPVERIRGKTVVLESDEELTGDAIVVATQAPAAIELLGMNRKAASRAVTCLYFEAQEPPLTEPILALNGEGGMVNNLCVPGAVAPTYAPEGKALVSASVLGGHEPGEALTSRVRDELAAWFGPAAREWRHIRTYRIDHALPGQAPMVTETPETHLKLGEGLYVCGDHRDSASINGAMRSGRLVAETILKERMESS